jgi:hypothetical protein
MTTTSITIIYRHPSERLAARLGRALLRWADERAVLTHERQVAAIENELALFERGRVATSRQYLRG